MRRDANARARLMRIGWTGLIFDNDFGAKENLEDICMYKQCGSLEGLKHPGVSVEKLTRRAAPLAYARLHAFAAASAAPVRRTS